MERQSPHVERVPLAVNALTSYGLLRVKNQLISDGAQRTITNAEFKMTTILKIVEAAYTKRCLNRDRMWAN